MTLYTRSNLESLGFVGWSSWSDIADRSGPSTEGVYVVHYSGEGLPTFLNKSPAGWFKGKDPTVPIDELMANWVEGSEIVYIGMTNNLRRRIGRLTSFGSGKPVGHYGGRLIWQISDNHTMLIAWRETPDEIPNEVKKRMLKEFRQTYGKPPFANQPHRLGR